MKDEKQNENKKTNWFKFIRLKPNLPLFALAFVFVVVFCCYYALQKTTNSKDKIINANKMKIATPEECKKPGLHYIGEMKVPRRSHTMTKLNDEEILISGGFRKGLQQNEYSAEIFNTKTYKFNKIFSKLNYNIHTNSFKLSNKEFLLTGDNLETYNTKFRTFKKYNPAYTKKYIGYSDILGNSLIQCDEHGKPKGNTCWSTNLETFDTQIIVDKIKTAQYTYEGYNNKCIKINDSKLLFYEEKWYAERNFKRNMFISVFDLKNKKFIFSNNIENIGRYKETSEPVVINDDIVLFLSGILFPNEFPESTVCGENTGSYSKARIYDVNKNQIIKELNFIFSDTECPIRGIKLANGNVLIIEGVKIRQIFNSKTMEFERIPEPAQLDSIYFEVISLNAHQLLITGGAQKNLWLSSKSAWIYTY